MAILTNIERVESDLANFSNGREICSYLHSAYTGIYRDRIMSISDNGSVVHELCDGVLSIEHNYLTKAREACRFESHIENIDIQLMVQGAEFIDLTDIHNLVISEKIVQKDIIYYEAVSSYSQLFVDKGDIMIFFPSDAHRPSIYFRDKSARVFKTVLKVRATQVIN